MNGASGYRFAARRAFVRLLSLMAEDVCNAVVAEYVATGCRDKMAAVQFDLSTDIIIIIFV